MIVITKDTYLESFDPISNIKENGILIINTLKTEAEILEALKPYKKILNDRHVTLYTINAYELARKCGLGNKISMIMESAILYVTGLVDYDSSVKYMNKFITDKFAKKSMEIVDANILGVKEAVNYLKKINLDSASSELSFAKDNIYETIEHRQGNKLKVSDFNGMEDGTFKHTEPMGRGISDLVPKWLSIQCGMCSIVCPHGVIRPFLLDKDEYDNAPQSVKEKCVPAIGVPDYYYIIGVSKENCTGCGVCINTCPGKKGEKALTYEKLAMDDDFDYLVTKVTDKKKFNASTIKGSQFKTPKFAFHGACAGCGETAYIKLLTQLFGENLMIANATGCSSIYGGSMPNNPYSVPWINSLFEDNAEFGYGILVGYETARERIRKYMSEGNDELFTKWLENSNSYDVKKFLSI